MALEVAVVVQRSAVLEPDSLATTAGLAVVVLVATSALVALQQPDKVTLAALASLQVAAVAVAVVVLRLLVQQD